MIDALIASTIALTVALVPAAIGGAIHRLSGIVNIGLEGHMLIGALVGAVASAWSGSWLVGLVLAATAGAASGLLVNLVITRMRGNEIIVGLGFNIVALGVVGYILRAGMGVSGTLRPEGLRRLPTIDVPGVADVPVLGALLSGQSPMFWFCLVLVPATAWLLGNTPWGLQLRATGALEPAAVSLGLRSLAIRDGAGLVAGLLSALGGATLSLGNVGLFNENMIAGRGYVALAAFYFGRSWPLPTALACLLFGFFDALQIRLQTGVGASADLLSTLPYLAVVVILTATALRELRRGSRRMV